MPPTLDKMTRASLLLAASDPDGRGSVRSIGRALDLQLALPSSVFVDGSRRGHFAFPSHQVFRSYEQEPDRILESLPILRTALRAFLVPSPSRPNDSPVLRTIADELVKQAIHDVVKKYLTSRTLGNTGMIWQSTSAG